MKKFITFICLAGIAAGGFSLSADAALVKRSGNRIEGSAGKATAKTKKTAEKSTLRTTENQDLTAHQWTNIGKGIFTDDVLTYAYWIEANSYEVDVEQAADNSNLYRIVNPLTLNPEREIIEADGGEILTDKDYYIYFDVTDPDFVTIPLAEVGYRDSDGVGKFCSTSAIYEDLGFSYEETIPLAGNFRDATISFPTENSCRMIQTEEDGTEHTFYSNYYGYLKLVLPGGIDYSVGLTNMSGFCPDSEGHYKIQVATGADVPTVRYGLFDSYKDEYVMQLINGGSECRPGELIDIDMTTFPERKAWLIVVTLDSEGIYRDGMYTNLYNPADNSEKWVFYRNADFTDGLLCPYTMTEPITKEIEVQQHTDYPGYFRIKNPYAGFNEEYMQDAGHNHGHYIYLDASDPMNVIMQESPVGVYGEDYGAILVGSDYWNMLLTYGKDALDELGYESGGLFADDVITFNAAAGLAIYPTLYGEWFTTNVNDDGSAGSFALAFKKTPTGIEEAEPADDGKAEYFDLRGMKVSSPKGGIFIERAGGKVRKVYIR